MPGLAFAATLFALPAMRCRVALNAPRLRRRVGGVKIHWLGAPVKAARETGTPLRSLRKKPHQFFATTVDCGTPGLTGVGADRYRIAVESIGRQRTLSTPLRPRPPAQAAVMIRAQHSRLCKQFRARVGTPRLFARSMSHQLTTGHYDGSFIA